MGAAADAAIEYFGCLLLRELYSPEKCFEVSDKTAELTDSDSLPVMPDIQAALFRCAGQRFMVSGTDGFLRLYHSVRFFLSTNTQTHSPLSKARDIQNAAMLLSPVRADVLTISNSA